MVEGWCEISADFLSRWAHFNNTINDSLLCVKRSALFCSHYTFLICKAMITPSQWINGQANSFSPNDFFRLMYISCSKYCLRICSFFHYSFYTAFDPLQFSGPDERKELVECLLSGFFFYFWIMSIKIWLNFGNFNWLD